MQMVETIRREVPDTDISWLAGFIDGEGCFYLGFNVAYDRGTPRKTFRTTIHIANTIPYPMEKATRILHDLGLGFSIRLNKPVTNVKWSRAMQLVVSGQTRAMSLSRILLPFLTGKTEQAKQMIYACEYRKQLALANGGNNKNSALIDDEVLSAMCNRMKELNAYRPDLVGYSMQASYPMTIKNPSQTTRLAALSAGDIVGSFERSKEA